MSAHDGVGPARGLRVEGSDGVHGVGSGLADADHSVERLHDAADVTPEVTAQPGAVTETRVVSNVATRRAAPAVLDIVGGLLGALPVLWVVGAVPWRVPTLLVEVMFTGFTRCALDSGSLTPLVMRCDRVGAPLGMYQLDGAVSYPFGGLLTTLGVQPLTAWKVSVATLVIGGFIALFHLGRRVTGSVAMAVLLVVASGFSHTLTARSWNWQWNATAASLLPLVVWSIVVLFDRARTRRLAPVVPAATAVLASVLVVALEWSYAGMFATAAAGTAVAVLVVQPRWTLVRRLLLLVGGVMGAAAVFGVQKGRLAIAGVHAQWDTSYALASEHAVDVAALLVPDPNASYLGLLLDRMGLGDVLVPSFAQGKQLWVAPYLGVLTLSLLACVWLWRRGRLASDEHCPPGVLAVLLIVLFSSIVLSLGPVVRVAGVALPGASYVAWTSWLWRNTPLEWIRFPWTWAFMTHVVLLVTVAILIPRLLRSGTAWSPVVWVLGGLVVLEFVSPAVLDAVDSPRPSVLTMPDVVGSDHPSVVSVSDAPRLTSLHETLSGIDGTVTLLPWDNTLIAPYVSPEDGPRLRNVGIDRNVSRSTQLAPVGGRHLRRPDAKTVQQLLESGWTDAVVLLDRPPQPFPILERHTTLAPARVRWRNTMQRLTNDAARAGACVRRGPWFSVITTCPRKGPAGGVPANRA